MHCILSNSVRIPINNILTVTLDFKCLEQDHEDELRTLREKYEEDLRSQEQEHLKELYHLHRRDEDIADMQEEEEESV